MLVTQKAFPLSMVCIYRVIQEETSILGEVML